MKTHLKQLTFDKELIKAIKASEMNANQLYIQLISGKITMKEYIAATYRAS